MDKGYGSLLRVEAGRGNRSAGSKQRRLKIA